MGSDWGALPNLHWHCSVAVGTGKKDVQRAVVNDRTKHLLRTQIVNARDLRGPEPRAPWWAGQYQRETYRAHVVLA